MATDQRPDAPAPDTHHGRHVGRRIVLGVVGLLVFVVVFGVAAIYVLSNTDWGREKVRQRVVAILNETAHGRFTIGRVTGNLLKGLTLHEIAITDSAGAPFLRADSVSTGYGIRSLISKKIELAKVRLWHPVIVLDRPPGGQWNWARIFPSDTTKGPRDTTKVGFGDYVVLHDLHIVNGDLTVRVPWAPDTALAPHARDSVVAVVTDTTNTLSRFRIVRVPGGFQNVQYYHQLYGVMPLVQLAKPHDPVRHIDIDSLRVVALPFRPPEANVRQVRGRVDLNADSLWFRNAALTLPGSQATLTGRYGLNSGNLLIAGRGAPVALPDVRFLMPALPDSGQGTLDFRVAIGTMGVSRYRFANMDVRSRQLVMRGDLGFSFQPAIRIDTTNVTFAGLDTKLLEQLVPVAKSPRRGTLSGRLAADGDLAALALDGDVAFDEPRSGRSRLVAAGEIGYADSVFRAHQLRVHVAPFQVALAKIFAPTLPVGGTVAGSATIDGSTAARLNVTGIDLTHLDRGQRSRIVGRAAVALGAPTRAPNAPRPTDPRRRSDNGEVGANNTPAPRRDAERVRVAGRGRGPWFDVDITAQPLSLVTVGRFAPALGLRGIATGPIRVTGTSSQMAFNTSLGVAEGGRIAAVGHFAPGPVPTYDLTASTRLFNAKAVVGKAPATSLTARMVARGRGTDPATMVASLDADLTTSTIDTVAIDSSKMRLRAAGGLLTVDTLAVRAPKTRVDLLGTFGLATGRSGNLSYLVHVDSLAALARYFPKDSGAVAPRPAILAERVARARADSTAQAQRNAVRIAVGEQTVRALPVDTPMTIARDSLAGAAYLGGVLTGNIKQFDVAGRAGGSNLVAYGSTARRARFAYRGLGMMTKQQSFAVAGVADSVSAAGFALDSVDLRGAYREPGGNVQVAIFQNKGSDLAAAADFGIYADRRQLRLGSLALRFDSTTWTATHASTVWWGQPGTEIDNLELTNGVGGRLFVDGHLPSAGSANLRVDLTKFQVADIAGLLQSDVPLRGLLGLNATVTGPLTAPIIRATSTVDSASYRGTALPDLRLAADYAGQRLTANAEARGYIASVVPQPRGRRGRREAAAPPPPTLRTLATASGTLPINLALQGVTGARMADDAPIVAEFRADSLPLDLASRFTDVVSDVKGMARGSGTVRGTVKKPEIRGDLALVNAQMRPTAAGILLKDLNGALHLRGDTVVIDSVAGRTDRRIAVAGGIGIKTPTNPTFDLQLTADNALVLDNEMGRIKADAQITMYGPMNGIFLSGGARVRGGVIYIPEPDTKEVISQGDPAVFAVIDTTRLKDSELVPAESPLLANLRTDIFLGVDRDTWVRSREANVEIYSDGDLRIRVDRTKQAIVLDGIMNTDRGQYTFLSKRFQVKSGSATFIGTQELDPNLQLVAEYEVPQNGPPLAIRILIGGTLSAPRISLESDAQPPIPQSDLISYLAFGNNTGQLLALGTGSSVSTSTAGGGLVGTTAALAQKQLASVVTGVLVDQLEDKTGRALGADVFNITPVSGLPDELASRNFGTGLDQFVRGTQIEFGKYFNRQLYVALQGTPVFFQGKPPIPGFVVQYRFANLLGLMLESNYQPRYFLPPPSLSTQDVNPKNALGLFLTRIWRF